MIKGVNERDIPYQSLIKHILRERIDQVYMDKMK
jgi:hypothetical protein